MFPVEFDHKLLESLPLISEDDVNRISILLQNIISIRVLPYFRMIRGTEAVRTRQVERSTSIKRLEDDQGHIRVVSLIQKDNDTWSILLHERVFDYFAFVVPASQTELHVSEGGPEEQKILALSEFMLRHQVEHILYPHESARELIRSDIKFALYRSKTDPTFFKLLKRAMTDELNGLKFQAYVQLLDMARQDLPLEAALSSMINSYVEFIGDLPEHRLHKGIVHYDKEIIIKILGLYYRRAGDTSYSLINRAMFFRKLFKLFLVLIENDVNEVEAVFNDFKQIWGVVSLFRELDLPESSWDHQDSRQVFELFVERLQSSKEKLHVSSPEPQDKTVVEKPKSTPVAMRSLADRVEEVKENPLFPPEVITVMEKNKPNAMGQSGSKYSEFIETLLAIPWGKIKPIDVPTATFEQGLDNSHFGLQKPKEIIADFFANLIWRYEHFKGDPTAWHGNGSAFLFVGPPGVGKTSLAVAIAESLSIPYHKISLGGMSDESELRGHGFTYEGSKPGAIVQGLMKMGALNGMFIMDEVDKAEKFAVATLLEILDPEQNHLFHDKYVQTTIDIDLSNVHFILTANTLETVPPPVVNRCEVVLLDRYSVDEKVEIARKYLIDRIRKKYGLLEGAVSFDPKRETDILRRLIKEYTYEAGVRQLERVIRTVFLRALRREVLSGKSTTVHLNRQHIRHYLEEPRRPARINDEDGIGEILGLGVNPELGVGSLIPIQVTSIKGLRPRRTGYLDSIHATGNIQKIMDESRTVATTAVLNCAEALGIGAELIDAQIHFHFMGGATPKDGPSAGGAIALALASLLLEQPIRRDVAMTGEIDTQGRISAIGGLDIKLETAYDAGCKTVIVPMQNLEQDMPLAKFRKTMNERVQILSYNEWNSQPGSFNHGRHRIQIIGVDHLLEAADIALIKQEDMDSIGKRFSDFAQFVGRMVNLDTDPAGHEFCLPAAKAARAGGKGGTNRHSYLCLIRPDIEAAVPTRFPNPGTVLPIFDISADGALEAVESILGKYHDESTRNPLFALLGSYSVLAKARSTLDRRIGQGRLIYLANNYTAQGIRLSRGRALVSKLYVSVSQSIPKYLDTCPYLKKLRGIYVIDLSFIPEKYRLDVKRAERILESGLNQWVHAVTPQVENPSAAVAGQALSA